MKDLIHLSLFLSTVEKLIFNSMLLENYFLSNLVQSLIYQTFPHFIESARREKRFIKKQSIKFSRILYIPGKSALDIKREGKDTVPLNSSRFV